MSTISITLLTANGLVVPPLKADELPFESQPEYNAMPNMPFNSGLPIVPLSRDAVQEMGKITALVGVSGSQVEYVQFADQPAIMPFKEAAQQEAEIRAHQTEETIRPSGDYVDCRF